MKRVKSRWYEKFSNTNHTAHARIFRPKNTYVGYPIVNEREVENRVEIRYTRSSMDWIKEMKVRLVELDRQARSDGKGFMARLKRRWDEEYKEYRFLDAWCLRENASRSSKEQSVLNLVLVLERSDAKRQLGLTTLEVQEVNPDAYQETEQQEHQKVGLQHEYELLQKLFLSSIREAGSRGGKTKNRRDLRP